MVTFAEIMRQRRKALDLTQAMLAERVGCAVVTIKKIEQEMRQPSREMAELLAEHLAISPEERDAFLRLARGEYVQTSVQDWVVPPLVVEQATNGAASAMLCVTREPELTRLETHLVAALNRSGRIVFISGEAGQGKTTLMAEFAHRAQARFADLAVANGNCDAYAGVGDPYLPFRDLLAQFSGDMGARGITGEFPQEQIRRLWAILPQTIQALLDQGPDLLDLFVSTAELRSRLASAGPIVPDGWARLVARLEQHQAQLNAPLQRQIFEQITQVFCTLAAHHPLLLILDDLQWTDRASAGLLFHLGRRLANSRILVLGAYRPSEVSVRMSDSKTPENVHPLIPLIQELKRRYGDIEIDLDQIAAKRARAFIDDLLDHMDNRLGEEFRTALLQHTGGHPLFTAELLREMLEQKTIQTDATGHYVEVSTIDWDILPSRVEAVIAHRVGRLPVALQETLKAASVEGEIFTAEVVAHIQSIDPAQLIRQLSSTAGRQHHLVQSLGSKRLGEQPLSPYRFQHILFQKYLYNSLDDAERAYLHEAVGKRLEQLYAGRTKEIAVQLAYHFEAAGLVAQTVEYLRQAAEQAVRLSAHEEAIAHLIKAMALVERLPETLERTRLELRLHIQHGASLAALKGWSAAEVKHAYQRTQVLAEQAGEPHQPLAAFGLVIASLVGGDIRAADVEGRACLAATRSQGDPLLVAAGHFLRVGASLHRGEFRTAQEHVRHVVEVYAPHHHVSHVTVFGLNLKVFAMSYGAHATWYLGFPDTALAQGQEAVMLARELAHPYTLAVALAYLAMLHQFRGEWQLAQALAVESADLSTEYDFPYYQAWTCFVRGWALTQQGQLLQGIALMEQSLADFQTMDTVLRKPYYLAILAESYGAAGELAKAQGLLAQALVYVEQQDDRCHEAEIYRLQGLLLHQDGVGERAEPCLRQALKIARHQGAKSLELRATVDLARLWRERETPEQAVHRLLSEVYEWFTEGFETPDLQEARSLLDQLSEDA